MTTKADALWCAEMIKAKEKGMRNPAKLYREGRILSLEEIANNLVSSNS
jgi:hypothetical protein